MDALDERVDRGRGGAAGDGDRGVVAAAEPHPRARRRQALAQLRQQLELAHRLTIPNRVAGPGARRPRPVDAACVTKVRSTWSAANHFCTGSVRPGRGSGRSPPRSRRVRLALQIGLAVLIFGFLVLTVIDQWSEIQSEGVHFHVGWLIPAIVILPLFYVFSALGWDLILRFLGYRIGFGRAQVAWGQPLLARYVPGSVLYVLGRVLLSERAGVPRRITIASIVYEQAISATSAIVVAAYFIINHPDLQGQPLRWAVLLLIPAAIVLLHPRVFGPLANRALKAFGREPLPAVISLRGVIALIVFYSLNWVVVALRHLLRRPLGHLHPLRRHPPGRLGPGDRLLRGAGHARRPGRARRPRRRLRLGGEGGAAGQELRARLADRDRRPRRDDGRRTDLRRRGHRARPPRGLEHRAPGSCIPRRRRQEAAEPGAGGRAGALAPRESRSGAICRRVEVRLRV